MAYMSPDPLSANWSYDSAIDLFSLNTMIPESFPMDIPTDMLWDPKDLPADFFNAPTDINGFTVSNDDSLSSDQESDDQAYSPTNFIASTPSASALDIPSPIALTVHPSQTQHQVQKRKASAAPSTPSTRYSSSPEIQPQQPMTTARKTRNGSDDSPRGRNAAKRAAHNIIEKRYRTNMNAKFVALEKAMSGSTKVSKHTSSVSSTATSKSSASLKKSEILSNAIAYMQELQETNERLRKELSGVNRGRVEYC